MIKYVTARFNIDFFFNSSNGGFCAFFHINSQELDPEIHWRREYYVPFRSYLGGISHNLLLMA